MPSQTNWSGLPLLAAGLITLAAVKGARAGDYINIAAESTSGTPVAVDAGGPGLIDLTRNLIEQKSVFAPLAGQDFQAALQYGGVKNAMVFQSNAGSTNVTLLFPAGLGFRFGTDNASILRLGYHGDFGHNYDSQAATLLLAFHF
jgi:hypothetical protein